MQKADSGPVQILGCWLCQGPELLDTAGVVSRLRRLPDGIHDQRIPSKPSLNGCKPARSYGLAMTVTYWFRRLLTVLLLVAFSLPAHADPDYVGPPKLPLSQSVPSYGTQP